MRSAAVRLGLALALLSLAAPAAKADVVTLKNGAEFDGVLVSQSKDAVVFRSDGVDWTFRPANVASVRADPATKAKELARAKAAAGRTEQASLHPVVVYGTSWCTWCARTKAFLSQRGVAFVERDVEHDPRAARDLAQLERRAGIRPGGVPVIDVGGTVIMGFDRPRLEAALAARR